MPRKEVEIVRQPPAAEKSSSSVSRSSWKPREDFSVPPIKAIKIEEKEDAEGNPIQYYEYYYEYDSDEEYDYSSGRIPEKKRLRFHPFHPYHALTLHRATTNTIWVSRTPCNACGGSRRGTIYFCSEWPCDFALHAVCASLAPTLTKDHLPANYQPPHPHNLCIFVTHKSSDHMRSGWLCSACGEIVGEVFARCVPCDFNLHLNCNQIQQHLPLFTTFATIGILDHETFKLADADTLISDDIMDHHAPIIQCVVCKRPLWETGHYYKCTARGSSLLLAHIGCALSVCGTFKLQLIQKKQITLDSHKKHPLYLYHRIDDENEIQNCSRCKTPISNYKPFYGCKLCSYYIEKSCLTLPKTITHPFHSAHPLLLQANHRVKTCDACYGRMYDEGLHYMCMSDDKIYRYHPKCTLFFENFYLPETINDPKCHFHSLTLKTRLVEVEGDQLGEENQSYCDACEEQRDPHDCLYYCHLCNFEVHVNCVASEVLGLLEQKQGDVKFVRVKDVLEEEEKINREKIAKDRSAKEAKFEKCPTLKEVLSSYIDREDSTEINQLCKVLEDITWDNIFGMSNKFDVSHEKLLYSDDPIINFKSKLNLNSNSVLYETKRLVFEILNNQYGEEPVIDVRDHQVTHNFATLFEGLFAKYGNFFVSCGLSAPMKMFLNVIFCDVVHKICNTWVKDVTEDLLIQWWNRLAMVQSAGFQIQFAFKNFKRVVYAYFGLRADNEAFKKITQVREELEELPKQIEALTRKLEEDKQRLKKLKDDQKNLKEAFRAKKSHLMRECLFEFEELMCDRAGVDFL